MDVHITMWKESINEGTLIRSELYEDFPAWWLDRVLR